MVYPGTNAMSLLLEHPKAKGNQSVLPDTMGVRCPQNKGPGCSFKYSTETSLKTQAALGLPTLLEPIPGGFIT